MRLLLAFALVAAVALVPGASAIQGPVVCVTEPCPWHPLPLCVGAPCDEACLVMTLVFRYCPLG